MAHTAFVAFVRRFDLAQPVFDRLEVRLVLLAEYSNGGVDSDALERPRFALLYLDERTVTPVAVDRLVAFIEDDAGTA